jgi:NitT/TauT family transport system substrate-binding protein
MTTLNLGLLPISDVSPVYVGIDQGFFEEEGLKIEITNASGGAALLPAVVAGDLDFAVSNAVSPMIAESQGLDISIVANSNSSTGDPDNDFGYILVPEGSDIETPADLVGRSIGVNALSGITEIYVRYAVEQAGGDPNAVRYVEVAPPDSPAALGTGQVDAIWIVEPFVQIIKSQGGRGIYAMYAEPMPDLTVGVYFTTAQYVEQNPEITQAFVRAMNRSSEFAQQNPDITREAVTRYTDLDPELVQDIVLPKFGTEINRDAMQLHLDLAQRYGLIDEPISLDDVLVDVEG